MFSRTISNRIFHFPHTNLLTNRLVQDFQHSTDKLWPMARRSISMDVQNSLELVKSSVYSKYRHFDAIYERHFGIEEMRQIQSEVLIAQSEFLEASSQRKRHQDQLNELNKQIRNLREKLESTSRSSEKYLELITEEHKLFRKEMEIELELRRYKDKEQDSYERLSHLLRRSHECERLRMERSKYYQIISIGLSVAGSLIAIVGYKIRDQKFALQSIKQFHSEMGELKERSDLIDKNIKEFYAMNCEALKRIEEEVRKTVAVKEELEMEKKLAQKLITQSWGCLNYLFLGAGALAAYVLRGIF